MSKEPAIIIDAEKLDRAIKKASQLVEILKEANRLIELLHDENNEQRIERLNQITKRSAGELRSSQYIRDEAKAAGVKLWQIADRLGITDCHFSRLLRNGLPEDKQAQIMKIIAELKQEMHPE